MSCRGLKELAARFRAANAHTAFEVERARKWIRGVALPRDRRIYDDWAAVIGSRRGGDWIAAATPSAFAAELVAALDADPTRLESALAALEGRRPGTPPRLDPASGTYVTYSRAYSRYYVGSLVRGVLRIAARQDERFDLDYRERYLEQSTLAVRGRVDLSGDLLACCATEGDATGLARPFLFLLRTPGHPPHILFGHILTAAVFGPEREPGASAFVAVRVDETAAGRVEEEVCYLEATEASIAADIRRLDLPEAAAAPLIAAAARVFGPAGAALLTARFDEFADACAALVRGAVLRD